MSEPSYPKPVVCCALHHEAPQLLAQLKKLLDRYIQLADGDDAQLVIETREVIAKAEG